MGVRGVWRWLGVVAGGGCRGRLALERGGGRAGREALWKDVQLVSRSTMVVR